MAINPEYVLRPFFVSYLAKIDWNTLSRNSRSTDLLEHNLDKINWSQFSQTSDHLKLLQKFKSLIHWNELLKVNATKRIGARSMDAFYLIKEYFETFQDKTNFPYWKELSENRLAIKILEENQQYINWNNLCKNAGAFDLLNANKNKIIWSSLAGNPDAKILQLLEAHLDKINPYNVPGDDYMKIIGALCWNYYCNEPKKPIEILIKYYNQSLRDNFEGITYDNGTTVPYEEYNREKLCRETTLVPYKYKPWEILLGNHVAIELIIDYENIICPGGFENFSDILWSGLSQNKNAIKILQKYPHKINWGSICSNENPDILDIICSHQDKIDWKNIWKYENIFEKTDPNANYGLVPFVSNGTTILIPMFQSYKQTGHVELPLKLPHYSSVVENPITKIENPINEIENHYSMMCLNCMEKFTDYTITLIAIIIKCIILMFKLLGKYADFTEKQKII